MKEIITRVLRLPEVMDRCGLSRSTIYEYMKQGRFPQSVQLGPKAIAWQEAEINQWIQSVIDRTPV